MSVCEESCLPVYITQSVDGVNGHDHLGQVELSHVLRDPVSKLTEQSQQVPSYIVVHHKVLRKEEGGGGQVRKMASG